MFKLACLLIVALSVSVRANTITVPDDYPTIQEAINAAVDGDIIELNRNVFRGDGNRDLDFLNKALTIRPAPGRAGVRIDPQGTMGAPHRAGHLINHTKPITFIDLVFERGYSGLSVNAVPAGEGGAFLIQNSTGITFVDCVFRDNTVRQLQGGGVASFDSEVRFENCHFHDNIISSADLGYGANLAVRGGAVELINSTLERGVHSSTTSFEVSARGLGAAFIGGTHLVDRCTFQENSPSGITYSYSDGSGIYIDAEVTVVDTVFRNNQARYDEDEAVGGRGGAADVMGGPAVFINCLFEGNSTSGFAWAGYPYLPAGGAVSVRQNGDATLINCTVTNNSIIYTDNPPGVPFYGTFFVKGANAKLSVRNSIVHGNTGPALVSIDSSLIDVEYSVIEGGAAGPGVIDMDPMLDAGFALTAGSPAIDSGDNTVVPAGILLDLAGDPRFVDDPSTSDSGVGPAPVVDMGAYEFQAPPIDCAADLTGDGVLDFFDVQEFLNLFAANDPAADFTNDGVFDFFDVQEFLNLYSAGCP